MIVSGFAGFSKFARGLPEIFRIWAEYSGSGLDLNQISRFSWISGFSGPRCSGSLRTKLRYEAMSTRLHVLDVYEARLSCSVYEARSTRLHVLELEPKWLPQHTFSTLHVLTRFAPQVESCASKLSYTCYIDI